MLALLPAAVLAQGTPRGANISSMPLDAIGNDIPGRGGDAVLPAGYRKVLWGIAPVPMQHVRGLAMEDLPTADRDVKLLIEAPPPGERSAIATVKYKFWREQLYRVEVFYAAPLTKKEGRELQQRFEAKYGTPEYSSKPLPRVHMDGVWVEPGEERTWVWSDPFTVQSLMVDTRTDAWNMVRQSRVIEYTRLVENRKEREVGAEASTDKIKNLEID